MTNTTDELICEAYARMAADVEREAEAVEWADVLILDAADESEEGDHRGGG